MVKPLLEHMSAFFGIDHVFSNVELRSTIGKTFTERKDDLVENVLNLLKAESRFTIAYSSTVADL